MKGPAPKDPNLRQRRNKAATRAVLTSADAPFEAPALPNNRVWHPMTLDWWRDVWASPMAGAFIDADRHALYRLAILVDGFWLEPSKEMASEIRQQEARFGLTPLDRRRLDWKIEVDEPVVKRETPVEADDPRVTMFRKGA